MTRWARPGVVKKVAHDGTAWKDLKKKTEKSKGTKAVTTFEKHQLEVAQDLAVKKDKRRENRRIKRIRKNDASKVCFHCRMPGHGMADCPMVKDDVEQGTDICFKCGSTEHRSSVCTAKVTKGKEFTFAKCFVCGETGHLSKSCPDNPRGLYPDGGCCQLCGSVEHYKKDCPDRKVKGEVTAYRLPRATRLSNGKRKIAHVSMDDEMSLYEDIETVKRPVKAKKKVVRF
uniref:ZF(CCHC)-16 zinc finger protein n=1 Tax=Phallusia mammillata TaxID=59560 RepID=A0A6F9DXZ7_9ASCI|nr:ZF(CCHC)-16 zinc finger protein [Phallusia mammillata]